MKVTGIFHPQFAYHVRPTVESAMLATVAIYQPSGGHPTWVEGVGNTSDRFELVWRSQARVQPNKDWRARPRESANEFTATEAIRVQVPIGKNLVGSITDSDGKIVAYGPNVDFTKDFKVIVEAGPIKGYENQIGSEYFVRNAEQSQNLWLYNLLCDTTTSGRDNV